MAKTIKRVGIIFFVLVVSLLVAVGSVFAVNVTSNGDMLLADSSNTATDNNSGNNLANFNNTGARIDIPDIPTADIEYELKHETGCVAQNNTCTCLETVWNNATNDAVNNGKRVKVTLMTDWIAKDDENHTFGSGVGFHVSGLIRVDGDVILDLNGHTIDKKFTETMSGKTLPVIYVNGDFTLMDSAYDASEAQRIYNENKANKEQLISKLKGMKCGRITGGATTGNGGGMNTNNGQKNPYTINIYGGMFVDNHATTGGGINVYSTGTINFYDGIIVDNNSTCGGGLSIVGGVANISGGIIVGNSATTEGGGVYAISDAEVNLYDGKICHNYAQTGSGMFVYISMLKMYNGEIVYNKARNTSTSYGGIFVRGQYNSTTHNIIKSSCFYMYGGIISYNTESAFAGGVGIHDGSQGAMYGGEISYNETRNDSAGMLVWGNSYFTIYGGKIHHNKINREQVNSNNGGGGAMVGANSCLEMVDGEITDNFVTSSQNLAIRGGGILLNGTSELILKGGIIKNNQVANTPGATGGGITFVDIYSRLDIAGGVQIYNNKVGEQISNLHIIKDQIVYVSDSLATTDKIAHVGVELASDYEGTIFTNGYSRMNNNAAPSRYFYSDANGKAITLVSKEVALVDGTKPNNTIQWKYGANSTTDTNISVIYTGSPYVIANTGTNIYQQGNNTPATNFSVTDAGQYAFYTTDSCVNPVFILTILPKEVNVLWKNNELVYNGGSQKPTAYIAEDANCKVTVMGEQVNSGVGYIATATGLSNKNYKINSSTMNSYFNIAKAKVVKPFGSGTFEFDGGEKVFTPNGYNFVTMDITGNKATSVGSYEATISLKDKLNYEWTDGGNEDIKLPYAITLAPVVEEDNSVYKFIYLDTEDNTRKTYTEGDLKHGLNDSNVNIKDGNAHYVLGNILPETSVKDFVQTLNYDSTKLKVFNNKGQEVSLTDEVTVVGSGWYIEYTPVVGGAKDTIYLSVLGDVTGDGRIDATDITYLRRIANGEIDKATLNPAILLAAMVDNRGKITSVDAEILRAICKYETVINKYF